MIQSQPEKIKIALPNDEYDVFPDLVLDGTNNGRTFETQQCATEISLDGLKDIILEQLEELGDSVSSLIEDVDLTIFDSKEDDDDIPGEETTGTRTELTSNETQEYDISDSVEYAISDGNKYETSNGIEYVIPDEAEFLISDGVEQLVSDEFKYTIFDLFEGTISDEFEQVDLNTFQHETLDRLDTVKQLNDLEVKNNSTRRHCTKSLVREEHNNHKENDVNTVSQNTLDNTEQNISAGVVKISQKILNANGKSNSDKVDNSSLVQGKTFTEKNDVDIINQGNFEALEQQDTFVYGDVNSTDSFENSEQSHFSHTNSDGIDAAENNIRFNTCMKALKQIVKEITDAGENFSAPNLESVSITKLNEVNQDSCYRVVNQNDFSPHELESFDAEQTDFILVNSSDIQSPQNSLNASVEKDMQSLFIRTAQNNLQVVPTRQVIGDTNTHIEKQSNGLTEVQCNNFEILPIGQEISNRTKPNNFIKQHIFYLPNTQTEQNSFVVTNQKDCSKSVTQESFTESKANDIITVTQNECVLPTQQNNSLILTQHQNDVTSDLITISQDNFSIPTGNGALSKTVLRDACEAENNKYYVVTNEQNNYVAPIYQKTLIVPAAKCINKDKKNTEEQNGAYVAVEHTRPLPIDANEIIAGQNNNYTSIKQSDGTTPNAQITGYSQIEQNTSTIPIGQSMGYTLIDQNGLARLTGQNTGYTLIEPNGSILLTGQNTGYTPIERNGSILLTGQNTGYTPIEPNGSILLTGQNTGYIPIEQNGSILLTGQNTGYTPIEPNGSIILTSQDTRYTPNVLNFSTIPTGQNIGYIPIEQNGSTIVTGQNTGHTSLAKNYSPIPTVQNNGCTLILQNCNIILTGQNTGLSPNEKNSSTVPSDQNNGYTPNAHISNTTLTGQNTGYTPVKRNGNTKQTGQSSYTQTEQNDSILLAGQNAGYTPNEQNESSILNSRNKGHTSTEQSGGTILSAQNVGYTRIEQNGSTKTTSQNGDYTPLKQNDGTILNQQITGYSHIEQNSSTTPIGQNISYIPIKKNERTKLTNQNTSYTPIEQNGSILTGHNSLPIEHTDSPINHKNTGHPPIKQNATTIIIGQNNDDTLVKQNDDTTLNEQIAGHLEIEQNSSTIPSGHNTGYMSIIQNKNTILTGNNTNNTPPIEQNGSTVLNIQNVDYTLSKQEGTTIPFLSGQFSSYSQMEQNCHTIPASQSTNSKAIKQSNSTVLTEQNNDCTSFRQIGSTIRSDQNTGNTPIEQNSSVIKFGQNNDYNPFKQTGSTILTSQTTSYAKMEQNRCTTQTHQSTDYIPRKQNNNIILTEQNNDSTSSWQNGRIILTDQSTANAPIEQDGSIILLGQNNGNTPIEQNSSTTLTDQNIINTPMEQNTGSTSFEQDDLFIAIDLNEYYIPDEPASSEGDNSLNFSVLSIADHTETQDEQNNCLTEVEHSNFETDDIQGSPALDTVGQKTEVTASSDDFEQCKHKHFESENIVNVSVQRAKIKENISTARNTVLVPLQQNDFSTEGRFFSESTVDQENNIVRQIKYIISVDENNYKINSITGFTSLSTINQKLSAKKNIHEIKSTNDAGLDNVNNNVRRLDTVNNNAAVVHNTNNSSNTQSFEDENSIHMEKSSPDIQQKDLSTGDDGHRCERCHKHFNTLIDLDYHKRSNKDPCRFTCRECGMPYTLFTTLHTHRMMWHYPTEYKCNQCNICFYEKTKLDFHMQCHDKYTCEMCKEIFLTRFKLRIHIKRHHMQSDKFVCEICNKSFDNTGNLDTHVAIHGAPLPLYKCSQCTKGFNLKKLLSLHEIHEHGQIRNKNIVRNETIQEKTSNIVTEKTVYIEKKNHDAIEKETNHDIIEINDKSNTTHDITTEAKKPHILWRRPNRHKTSEVTKDDPIYGGGLGTQCSSVKSYNCKYCDKSYKREISLIRHQRFHPSFKCDTCSKTFKKREYCRLHQLTHTVPATSTIFFCHICNIPFPIKFSLEKHLIESHFDEMPYKCTYCVVGFNKEEDLLQHLADKHIQLLKTQYNIRQNICIEINA